MNQQADDEAPAFVLFGDLPKIGPYLLELAQRGLAVLVVSGPPRSSLEARASAFLDAPGHPFSAITDARRFAGDDHAGILDQVVRWSRRYRITGVLAATEIFVEPAALATDLLGLPGVSLRAARVCRNKFLQRQYLRRWSPLSRLVTPDTRERAVKEFEGMFPVVVKPLDLWSSIGVRAFNDPAALAAHLDGLGPDDRVLVEQRVDGREFNVDAIVVDGEPAYGAITQKGTNEEDTEFFAELIHTLPPTNLTEGESREVLGTHAALVRELGFGTGMAHAEYRVTPSGEVVLMEIAARPPGDGCLHLYHLTTGRPVEGALIDAALGRPVSYPAPARRARQVYFEHAPGRLDAVIVRAPFAREPAWVLDPGIWPPLRPGPEDGPGTLREVMVLKERGEPLTAITESGHRAVTAIFDCPLAADIGALERQVRDSISISTLPAD